MSVADSFAARFRALDIPATDVAFVTWKDGV
jgi:hypothetical protein